MWEKPLSLITGARDALACRGPAERFEVFGGRFRGGRPIAAELRWPTGEFIRTTDLLERLFDGWLLRMKAVTNALIGKCDIR